MVPASPPTIATSKGESPAHLPAVGRACVAPPDLASRLTVAWCPRAAATKRGVWLSSSTLLTGHPLDVRYRTIAASPLCAAVCTKVVAAGFGGLPLLPESTSSTCSSEHLHFDAHSWTTFISLNVGEEEEEEEEEEGFACGDAAARTAASTLRMPCFMISRSAEVCATSVGLQPQKRQTSDGSGCVTLPGQ